MEPVYEVLSHILCDSPGSNASSKDPRFSHQHQLKSLASTAQRPDLLGATAEEKALIQQWIELAVTQLAASSDARGMTEELDSFLSTRGFLVGHRLTLADLVLFAATHAHFSALTFQEKERVPNASRWFAHVQNCVRQMGRDSSMAEVTFIRNKLYQLCL